VEKGGRYIIGALGMPKMPKSGNAYYQQARYLLKTGEEARLSHPTGQTIKALAEFFPDYAPVLLVTPKAMEHGWPLVVEEFGYEPEYIQIPNGSSEEEIWTIVTTIFEALAQDSQIIIDVTRGFRALPLLTLQSILMAEEAGRIKEVAGIYYGALEAASKDRDGNSVTPFFDLTPLFSLHKWSRALHNLSRFSSAELLFEMLKEPVNFVFRNTKSGPGSLSRLSNKLEKLGLSLVTMRTGDALRISKEMAGVLPDAEKELEQFSELKAIASFLQPSFRRLSGLAPHGYRRFEGKDALLGMANLIRYYLETKAYQEAVTLAREALVSAYGLCYLGAGDEQGSLMNADWRRQVEEALNQKVQRGQEQDSSGAPDGEEHFLKLWRDLGDLRNDVNHAGFRKNARPAKNVAEQSRQFCERAADFVEECANNLTHPARP